jgi:amidase
LLKHSILATQGLPEPEFSILVENVKKPSVKPNLQPFHRLKAAYRGFLRQVFDKYGLDTLVYPQLTDLYPPLESEIEPTESTVSEANIAGTPVVVVPSTRSKAPGGGVEPFALSFMGLPNSEAKLLALAHDYEQASMLRVVPALTTA